MSAYGLVLEASREAQRIKVSVYERGGGIEGTLRPYEDRAVPWEQVESATNEITTLLNRANRRGKVTSEILQSLKKSGQLLFDLLISPKASEKINSTSASSLVLYIDDKLVQIPWELLYTGQEFLCRRFAMGRVVSTSQVPTAMSRRSLKNPLKVLVLADPRQDLKASYREGVDIRNLLDQERDNFAVDFKSAPVDISFVKKNLRDYDIVHYAGHADYNPQNPSDGGWLLTDGRLKAGEISAMGGLQPMPFLVFSNACQSGQSAEWRVQEGYGQQIFGLANAHLMAGVQHYVGTFWEILDEPSSYFARRFYGSLARGDAVGEAVRKAREALIGDFGEETIVWASYMLYGDPAFEFVTATRAPVKDTVIRSTAPIEWSDAIRSQSAAAPVVTSRSSSGFPYLLLGVLAVLLAISGYTFFSPEPLQVSTITPTPPVASPKIVLTPENPPKPVAIEAPTHDLSPRRPAAPIAKVPVSESTLETPAITQTVAPVVVPPLSLSMNIIGQRKEADGSYSEVLVNEGSILRSRDNFQVHVEVNRPSYVYILIYDSQGKAGQLFPDAKIDHPEFIEAGRKATIPRRDLWFWLDDETGTETIYVLASEKPMSDIQGLLAKMEAADESGKKRVSQEIKLRIGAMQRGVGGITKGQAVTYALSDGKKIQKVTDVVTGTGSVVRAVSFQHR